MATTTDITSAPLQPATTTTKSSTRDSVLPVNTHHHLHHTINHNNLTLASVHQTLPEKQLGSGQWLQLSLIEYTDPAGHKRNWECVRRKHHAAAAEAAEAATTGSNKTPAKPKIAVDAVDIIPIIKNKSGEATHLVLVVQYRPPLGSFTIEFPSGLIDPGESLIQTALRELREETGYIGTSTLTLPNNPFISNPSLPVAYEPGITGSCTSVVVVTIELDDPLSEENIQKRERALEEDEWSLQVLTVPLKQHQKQQQPQQEGRTSTSDPTKGLLQILLALQNQAGGPEKLILDSRLYAWAIGREMGI